MPMETEFNERTGLVLIDVQKAFNHLAWGKRNNPAAEHKIAVLLAEWRERGLPVSHVRHASVSPAGYFREGEASFEFKAEAMPLPREPVYTKSVNSAFIGTRLERDLRARNIDTLVIVGLTTNHCVSTTARMSGNFGFATFVVEDATATFEGQALNGSMRTPEEVHGSALSDLRDEFATIVSTAEVLKALPDAESAHGQRVLAVPANERPSAAARLYIDRITANLQGRQPLEVLRSTMRAIEEVVKPASEDALAKSPTPGKWSANEILAHLADTETVMGYRLRQVLSHDGIEIAGFDQDRWAMVSNYPAIPVTRSIARLGVNRAANLDVIENLTPDQMTRYGVHAERGRETVAQLCRMWAGHDLNHLTQLKKLLP